jgi:hypothetical protein
MQRASRLAGFVLAGLALTFPAATSAVQAKQSAGREFVVLVFTKSAAGRTPAIDAGAKAIRKLGRENGFAVEENDNPRLFERKRLDRYRAIVFLNTSGELLNRARLRGPEARVAVRTRPRPATAGD